MTPDDLRRAGVRVRPLEWKPVLNPREDGPAEETGDWEASCIVGSYHVYLFEDHYEVTREDGEFVEYWNGDADEAKAAAQQDYATRILSALEPIPGGAYRAANTLFNELKDTPNGQ